MNLSFFLAKRLIGNHQYSFSRFIVRLATAATAVSVATIIITLSCVNGFQHEVSAKVYGFWGHIRVQPLEPVYASLPEESTLTQTPELENTIMAQNAVSHFQAMAIRSVVLRSSENFEGLMLKGVDEKLSNGPFLQYLMAGKPISFATGDYSKDLWLSTATASRLNVKLGDTITVVFMRNGEEFRSRKVVFAGMFKTGIADYDNNFALADIRLLQRLSLWESNQIGGYELWINNLDEAAALAKKLNKELPQGVTAYTVRELYPNLFDWLAIQTSTKRIVTGVMLAVAAINLITCLLILVMERTRMVALLSSFGMPVQQQGNIFWYYTLWVAGVGVLSGLALSLALLLIQHYTGIIKMDEATYYVDRVPIKIIGWQVAAVVIGSFALCTLALRIPLRYIRRISVVKALRFS